MAPQPITPTRMRFPEDSRVLSFWIKTLLGLGTKKRFACLHLIYQGARGLSGAHSGDELLFINAG